MPLLLKQRHSMQSVKKEERCTNFSVSFQYVFYNLRVCGDFVGSYSAAQYTMVGKRLCVRLPQTTRNTKDLPYIM